MKKFNWIICSCCQGNGKVDHPAFSNGITDSEWAHWDESEQQAYMAGRYDIICNECDGFGKLKEPIVSALSFTEKRVLASKRIDDRIEREMYAEMAAERRFGA